MLREVCELLVAEAADLRHWMEVEVRHDSRRYCRADAIEGLERLLETFLDSALERERDVKLLYLYETAFLKVGAE